MCDNRRFRWLMVVSALVLMRVASAQEGTQNSEPAAASGTTAAAVSSGVVESIKPLGPIAIVPVEGVKLTGSLNVEEGKAALDTGGTIVAGPRPATITLPRRGNLRLCATSRITLTADSSIAANLAPGEEPGLMMALDHGALEASFATGQNSDVILTPDFRIVISGPGTASVQVRLGSGGDTCVENRGPDAPYVSVSSIFEGGFYRVHPDQRVLFEGGDLGKVVDTEKEPCGCPPETPVTTASHNEFPLAQSEGLASPPPSQPPANAAAPGVVGAQATAKLSYDGAKPTESQASVKIAEPVLPPPAPPSPVHRSKPKHGFLRQVGYFFRNFFGG
jgi:hypothetical protein